MPKMPDIRNLNITASQAKDVKSTKMLDTEAHEPDDTVRSSPEGNFREHTGSHGPFGKLGYKGRE